MTSRVPPSTHPARPGAARPAQQARQAARPRRTQQAEKPKPVKMGGAAAESAESPEVGLWGGKDYDKSLAEVSLADIEGLAHEQASAEEATSDAAHEHEVELHEAAEREEHGGKVKWSPGDKPSAPRPDAKGKPPIKQAPQQGSAQLKKTSGQPTSAAQAAAPTEAARASSTSFSSLAAVGQVQQNLLQGTLARSARPPDAFALLKEAKEKGVFYTEDALRDGHREDQEDPELAAAVEECIRQCFGVLGILRVGPGRNEKAEPIIVVVASAGFTEASLAKVPEKVHRFPTLLAIPFELLPLRRDR